MASNIFQFILFVYSLIVLSNMPSTNINGLTGSEQLALNRDVERKSGVAQMGHAVEAYLITQGDFPQEASWIEDIVDSGELSTIPDGVKYELTQACNENVMPISEPTFCYRSNEDQFLVYATLEQLNEKCEGKESFVVYSYQQGRVGEVCGPITEGFSDIVFID